MDKPIEQVNNEKLPNPFIPYNIETDPLRNFIILEEENGLLTYLPIEMLTQEQINSFL
jgi:hypothetical protein